MRQIVSILSGLTPVILMLAAQMIFAGLNVCYKLAANDGMSSTAIITYRHAFAALFMVPSALIFERNSLAKLSPMVLFQGFLAGLLGGSLGQNLYVTSLTYTSATFVSAMFNLAPAFTFILAVIFRLEKLGLGTKAGNAKVLGTLLGVGGAMLLTFYKGREFDISTDINILAHDQLPTPAPIGAPAPGKSDKFLLGAVLALLASSCLASWLIVQAKMGVRFPFLHASTALMSVMGLIQSAVFALCTERDWSKWKLGWNIRLLCSAFAGVFGSGLMVIFTSWAIRLRGPLYASSFGPLGLLFVAIAGCLLLEENLYMGSIMGGILIVCGLYVMLWGKSRDMKQMTKVVPTTSDHKEGFSNTITVEEEQKEEESNKNQNTTEELPKKMIGVE